MSPFVCLFLSLSISLSLSLSFSGSYASVATSSTVATRAHGFLGSNFAALIGGTVKTADAELADCGGNYVAIQMWPMFVLEPAAYVDEQITFIPIQAKKKVFTEKLGSRVKTLCF